MTSIPTGTEDNVIVLFKGGRLPIWHRLNLETQREYERIHVDLMLEVAQHHKLIGVQGYKLVGPQQSWEKFWVIEFPTMSGAEEWISAEMAPPYGTYGNYEYHLARRLDQEHFSRWVTNPRKISRSGQSPNSANVPTLGADMNTVIVLMFTMFLPEHAYTPAEERGDAAHIDLTMSTARSEGLMTLEGFDLISPQPDWRRVWVCELPTLEAAEAWVDSEVAPPYGSYCRKSILVARRWAPDYFSTWGMR